ncbi:MAG: pantoate--beta-alanine ligase [Oceanococcus sp.]
MKRIHQVEGLREIVRAWKQSSQRVGFVPTMGNLHDGHLSLIDEAQRCGERVVVSIFVNPLQFAKGEDFGAYPRTFDEDCRKLEQRGVDVVFAPSDAEMYPRGRESLTQVVVPGLSELLCGAHRQGHFAGVATVVNLLFNLVQPDFAVFGQKDYQQLAVIRRMVADLQMPVEIIGMPTRREEGGLAMSSRNIHLSAEQRDKASAIYASLNFIAASLKRGDRDFSALEAAGLDHLRKAGLKPQYLCVLAPDLSAPDDAAQQYVVLAAAKMGDTRLIDNLSVDSSGA